MKTGAQCHQLKPHLPQPLSSHGSKPTQFIHFLSSPEWVIVHCWQSNLEVIAISIFQHNLSSLFLWLFAVLALPKKREKNKKAGVQSLIFAGWLNYPFQLNVVLVNINPMLNGIILSCMGTNHPMITYTVSDHWVKWQNSQWHSHILCTVEGDAFIKRTNLLRHLNCNFKIQVVKVIWHKAASPPQMDGSAVFFKWRQCAPHI